MALTEYLPMVVADPVTKIIRTDLFGTKVTVVLPGTTTPVTGIIEAASGAPLANPITVSSTGFTPWFKINDGPTRVDIVSGDFRTPVWSPTGLEASATAAAASAAASAEGVEDILELADVVDLIPGTNITMTPTPQGVVIASTGGGGGEGGPASWAEIKTFPDFPPTFAPTIGSTATTAVAGNDSRLANERTPTNASVTDAKVATVSASNPGISLDKTRDSSSRLAMTPEERTKLANVGAGGVSSVTYENLPAGTLIVVRKTNGTWPARPTARTDITIDWTGTAPFPPIVASGTGGMLDNVDRKSITP